MHNAEVQIQPSGNVRPLHVIAALVILGFVIGIAWISITANRPGQVLLDATLEQLEANVIDNPQDPDARLAIAIAYAARGHNESAIEQYLEALKLSENNHTALIGLGRVYMDEGELDMALERLLLVIELNKDNPVRSTLDQLEAVYYNVGTIYFQKREHAQAAPYFQSALEINPVDADAWYMLGHTLQESGEFEAALSAYGRAVRLVPDYVDAYKGLGGIYGILGREGEKKYASGMIHLSANSFDKALKDLEEAALTVPEIPEVHQGLGLALESQGRFDEALESYQTALDLDPDLMVARFAVQRLSDS